jgi:hypothetical protein
MSAQDALAKARPELDKGLQLADQVNPQEEQQKFANTSAMVKDGKYTPEAFVAMARAYDPVRARVLYANALNHAAVELYQQADKTPDKSADLRKQADDLNKEAIDKLKQIGQKDNQYGSLNPDKVDQAQRTIDGFIIQANRHEAMDGNTAAARSYGETAKTAVDLGLTTYGATGLTPVSVAMDALAPIGFPSFSWEERPAAVKNLTMAHLNDPDTAQKVVDEGKQQNKNTWVHTAIDLVSGPAALYAAEKAGTALANYIPNPALRLGAQGLIAIGGTVGAEKGLDWLASQTLHSDQLNREQWLSHSGASLGMALVGRGAVALTSKWAAEGVAEGSAVKAAANLNPKLAGSLDLTANTEAARAYQLGRGLKAASSEAQDAIVAARNKEFWWFQKGQWAGDVKATESVAKAARFSEQAPQLGEKISMDQLVKNETGAELGSKWSYLKPQNAWDGLKQRTLQVGEDGKLVGSIRDLNSRMLWSKVAPAAAGGGVAAGVYSWADVNPWLTKPDGTNYTPEEIAKNTLWDGGMGALASGVFAPAVPAIGKVVKDQATGIVQGFGRGLEWLAPKSYKAVGDLKFVQALGTAGENVSSAAGATRDWFLAPQKDLNTVMKAPFGFENGVNTWTRGYAPYMSLPIYNGVLSQAYGNYYEWDHDNNIAKTNAELIREHNQEEEDKAKAAQQQAK